MPEGIIIPGAGPSPQEGPPVGGSMAASCARCGARPVIAGPNDPGIAKAPVLIYSMEEGNFGAMLTGAPLCRKCMMEWVAIAVPMYGRVSQFFGEFILKKASDAAATAFAISLASLVEEIAAQLSDMNALKDNPAEAFEQVVELARERLGEIPVEEGSEDADDEV